MVAVGGSIARYRAVQRIQIIRQQRIGKLLVQVRQRAAGVAAEQRRFADTLSTVAALQSPAGGAVRPERGGALGSRLEAVARDSFAGLERSRNIHHKLEAREAKLSVALSGAKKAQERSTEQQIEASHLLNRLREAGELLEAQGDDEVNPLRGIERSPAELASGALCGDSGECLEGLFHPRLLLGVNPERVNAPSPEGAIQPLIDRHSPSETCPASFKTPRYPATPPTPLVREIVVAAELPSAAGTVEVAHSPQLGVSISLRTRSERTAASSRRSLQGIRESLKKERVRIASVDLVEEES